MTSAMTYFLLKTRKEVLPQCVVVIAVRAYLIVVQDGRFVYRSYPTDLVNCCTGYYLVSQSFFFCPYIC